MLSELVQSCYTFNPVLGLLETHIMRHNIYVTPNPRNCPFHEIGKNFAYFVKRATDLKIIITEYGIYLQKLYV